MGGQEGNWIPIGEAANRVLGKVVDRMRDIKTSTAAVERASSRSPMLAGIARRCQPSPPQFQ